VRFALFHEEDLREAGWLSWLALESSDFAELGALFREHSPSQVVVGSVRSDRLARLREKLPRGSALTVAGEDFQVPVENHYLRPYEVGLDRLLNALAAGDLWPGSWRVVLDFGTALSVTVITPQGAFAGGLIGVGAGAAAAALRSHTPALPPVEVRETNRFVERSTREGVASGLFWQLVGGAQTIVDGLRRELRPPVHVVATGGDAPWIAPALQNVDSVDALLTLKGLILAFVRARP
jgi:type III pantothenate kinase